LVNLKLILTLVFAIVFVPFVIWALKKIIPKLPFKSYEWFIAKTYFKSNKNKGFISLISNISIVGLTLGTASVILAMSFMDGMKAEMINRFVEIDSHIKIEGFFGKSISNYEFLIDSLKKNKEIKSISPKVFSTGMMTVSNQRNLVKPVLINGIDLVRSSEAKDMPARMIAGEFDLREKKIIDERGQTRNLSGIVLGQYLAADLNLTLLDTGKILLVSSLPKDITFGSTPTIAAFYFAGIADLGLTEYNLAFAYTTLKMAQRLNDFSTEVSYLDIKLHDANILDTFVEKIDGQVPYPYRAKTWKEERIGIFKVINFEKQMYLIALGLMIILAGFNIISTLYMLVKDKTKEIGVLRSLGSTKTSIAKIFIYQGSVIGIIGGISGILLGISLAHIQEWQKVVTFPPGTMIIDYLPVELDYFQILPLFIFTILISVLAGIYPAMKASEKQPVEALKYE
jgi:lipoprotein-releasing system permease protein